MAEPYFIALTTLYAFVQIIYSLSFLVDLYLYSRPVNWVDTKETIDPREDEFPFIVLFYPVLKEPEGTMYTTMKDIRYKNTQLRLRQYQLTFFTGRYYIYLMLNSIL